mmetsp:Transcript_15220/g.44786  ORF Transcript_15220/g.44786 Transcript_15220/m.44786 type:complete len:211 (+) Transcript_15220:2697-3329(+)
MVGWRRTLGRAFVRCMGEARRRDARADRPKRPADRAQHRRVRRQRRRLWHGLCGGRCGGRNSCDGGGGVGSVGVCAAASPRAPRAHVRCQRRLVQRSAAERYDDGRHDRHRGAAQQRRHDWRYGQRNGRRYDAAARIAVPAVRQSHVCGGRCGGGATTGATIGATNGATTGAARAPAAAVRADAAAAAVAAMRGTPPCGRCCSPTGIPPP